MRSKPVVIVAVVLGAVAGGLLAVIFGFLIVLGCTSGDGGVPYTAPDSPQADICGATGDGLVLFAVIVAAVAGSATAAYLRGRAWLEGRASPLAFILLVALTVVAPMLLTWLFEIPSDGTGTY